MNANYRQLSLLYEFLNHTGQYLTYPMLCEQMNVSEKTIHNDIQVINDTIRKNNLQICLRKNRGFLLQAQDPRVIRELKNQFRYRFYNVYDLQENFKLRINTILKQLLISEGYIKLQVIADQMWLNPQSISREMKEVRKMLSDYNLKLVSRPYHGMKIEGNEINYRFCYMDSICYYNHKVKMMDVFLDVDHKDHMEGREREEIARIVSDLICSQKLAISDLETRKWIVMIMLSNRRQKAGHSVTFSEEQARLLDQFRPLFPLDDLCLQLKAYYGHALPVQEQRFQLLFLLCNLDLSDSEIEETRFGPFYDLAAVLFDKIRRKFASLDILSLSAMDAMKTEFLRFLIPIVVRMSFKIPENNTTSELVRIAKQTPVSCQIAIIIHDIIQNWFDCDIGEVSQCLISLFLYRQIKKIENKRMQLRLAVYPVANVFVAEALKEALMERLHYYVQSVAILRERELTEISRETVDFLICFDESVPVSVPDSVPVLKIDYYLNNNDYDALYQNMIQPSLQYETPFSSLSRDDIYLDAHFSDVEQLKKTLISFYLEELDQQWLAYLLYRKFLHLDWLILDETLNILLFTSEKRRMMTKLFYLVKPLPIKNKKIKRIYFFVIRTDGDPIRLNTAEMLIRCMTEGQPRILKDEADNLLDPYEYYIHQRKVKISG
ncbi:BglG family transcription antiterminator [Holdemania massiliensis]|uniref:BglG family transcription antiterminator n=1 Tax=Holdemania massiliensis TaxID=1468449 RepID=UPI001F05151B|nr:HTH domain-containing protein [Holdemania massiliensis]MCH1939213.1 helix-turn-helix domain-containing protein [Holdemania massiliensis]